MKAEFALFAVGLVPDAQAAMTVDAALSRLTDALEPWDAGRALVNFTEKAVRFHDGFTQHRLRALKAQLDRRACSRAVGPPPWGLPRARVQGPPAFRTTGSSSRA